jgi:Magnesium chelatase, subunit ChlI
MTGASPLTVAPTVGQRPWPSAPRQYWRMQRRCRHSAHNLLLLAPQGPGKAMLTRRLTTILPAMTHAEAVETTHIHSMPGMVESRCHVQRGGFGLEGT